MSRSELPAFLRQLEAYYPESLIRETRLEAFLMNLGLGPHEWLGVGVIGGDEGVDMGHQFLAVTERSPRKGLGRQDREPDFSLIEP